LQLRLSATIENQKKMEIKGKFKTFGYWLSVLSFVGGISTGMYFLIIGFNNTPLAGKIFFFVVLTILVGAYGRLLYDSNLLKIDTANSTIAFTNQLTRKHNFYHFEYFDGKIVCFEPIKAGYARNLYLVKEKRAVKKITDFTYSNYTEIEEALKPIQNLGTFNYSYLKSWKISLGLPILD
jgi:hypothetical protein